MTDRTICQEDVISDVASFRVRELARLARRKARTRLAFNTRLAVMALLVGLLSVYFTFEAEPAAGE